jgi:hypothetical protein
MTDLEPKLSRVTFKVDKPARGQTVKMDEQPLPQSAWGSPFARDPGKHQLEASAPGKKTWTQEVTIAAGPANADIVVPALEDAPVEKPSPAFSASTGGTNERGSNTKTLGYIVGGVGVAGLAVGGIFGLMYLSKRDENNNTCTATTPTIEGRPCDFTANSADMKKAEDLKSSAETLGIVSTIGFIAGAVGVGAGAYFILTSKSPDKTTAATTLRFAPTGGPTAGGGAAAGLRLEGAF